MVRRVASAATLGTLGAVAAPGAVPAPGGVAAPGAVAGASAPAPDVLACGPADRGPTHDGSVQLSATLHGVRATLSGQASSFVGQPVLVQPFLTITASWSGRTTTPVPPAPGARVVIPSFLTGQASAPRPLCLVHFPANRRPTVLVSLTTGGAHCCGVLEAYTPGSHGWHRSDDALGNSPATLTMVGDSPVIFSFDGAFAYRFANFAGSSMPIRLLQVDHGTFVDVTRDHLAVVARDAAALWTHFSAERDNPLGVLAAWAADQCELGRGDQAFARLAALARAGSLSPPDLPKTDTPSGSAYVTALRSFLVARGYCLPSTG